MELTPHRLQRPLLWPPLVEQLAASTPNASHLYLVGGVVRDALRGVPGHDLDLATPGDGLKVAQSLADALGGKYYPVDPKRRTGRSILETNDKRITIDVASFRGQDLLDDLAGRDFTINAMATRLDSLDELIDPLGGQHDLLERRVLRQCRSPSIADDPIRALRAVRQSIQLKLRIETETLMAVRAAAAALIEKSGKLQQPERCRDELFKMLSDPKSAAALRLLHMLDLLEPLCPFPLPSEEILSERLAIAQSLSHVLSIISPARDDNTAAELTLGMAVMVLDHYRRQLQDHLAQTFADGRPWPALLLLTSLTPPGIALGEAWRERLRLSNDEAHVLDMLEKSRHINLLDKRPIDDRAIYRYYQQTGETGIDGVLLTLAEYLARNRPTPAPEAWGNLLETYVTPLLEAIFRRHQQVIAPPRLLDGKDLLNELKLKPGPHIGHILEQIQEEQAVGKIHTKNQALRLAKRLANEILT